MARLLVAQQVPRPANIEIVAGQLEPGPKAFQRLQHAQPPLGGIGQLLVRRHREQRIGARLGPADTAADLIELRQPEMVGAMHDQRIGIGNIEPRFDDRRRHQHVELVVVEGIHDVVELARRHLPIGDHEATLRAPAPCRNSAISGWSLMRGTT